jgi:hypothetical protein
MQVTLSYPSGRGRMRASTDSHTCPGGWCQGCEERFLRRSNLTRAEEIACHENGPRTAAERRLRKSPRSACRWLRTLNLVRSTTGDFRSLHTAPFSLAVAPKLAWALVLKMGRTRPRKEDFGSRRARRAAGFAHSTWSARQPATSEVSMPPHSHWPWPRNWHEHFAEVSPRRRAVDRPARSRRPPMGNDDGASFLSGRIPPQRAGELAMTSGTQNCQCLG